MNDNQLTKREDLANIANAFKESRVLLTGVELGIFTVLDKHMMIVEDIAKAVDSDVRALDRLLSVLVGMGVLRKSKKKYYNSDLAKEILNKNSPAYLGVFEHTSNLWNSWSTLTEAVKKGTSVFKDEINERPANWKENFIAAMHGRAKNQAGLMALMVDLSGVKKMLDIGGGSGAFTFSFLERYPEMQSVIFDLPEIIPITEKYIGKSNYQTRIELKKGDYLKDDFPANMDFVFLSAIIHINSFEENKHLISKCYDCLNCSGQIVISDYIMEEDRVEPYNGALFALNMLTGTTKGDTYTHNEIKSWLTEAGFINIECKGTSFGTKLCLAKKP